MKNLLNQKNIEKFILIIFIFLGLLIIFNLENKINYYAYLKSKSIINNEQNKLKLTNKNNGNLKIEKVNIEINDNEFNPKIIKVNFGSKVIFNIKVLEGYHNLNIEGYEIKSK